MLKSKKGDSIGIIDAFVFDKFKVKSKFFFVFAGLENALNRLERFKKSKYFATLRGVRTASSANGGKW